MIYSDLPAGASVFVDAGPFIYHFEPNPIFGSASTNFLERVENQEINAVTSGLLHNDALIIAAMHAHGLTHLASADPDLDRIPGITRYAPA